MARVVGVALAALLLSSCGHGSSSSPTSAPPAPSVVERPFRCPDPRAEPTDVVDHGADTLPTGARAAVLCLHDNHLPWVPPRGSLTSGLDRLVRRVNAQRIHDPHSLVGCGGVGAPAWSIVFRYADGTRTITGDNGGCWDLLVGSTERVGSKSVFLTFLRALLRQRAHERPRIFHASPSPCPAAPLLDASDPIADASKARFAVLCVYRGHTPGQVPLTGARLKTLRRDFATAAQRPAGADAVSRCAPQRRPALVVHGLDAWRGPFDVYVGCGAYRTLRPGAPSYSFATLRPRTQRMLARLQGRG